MFSLAQAGSHPTQAAAALAADRLSHLRLGRPPLSELCDVQQRVVGNLEHADPEPQTSLVPLVLSHLLQGRPFKMVQTS